MRKSGSGAVRARSSGTGAVGGSAPDRRQDEPVAQARAIPRGVSHELWLVLDGTATQTAGGFVAESDANEARIMFIPFHIASSPTAALVIWRGTGLLRAKLDEMSAEDSHYVYLTTLTRAEPEN
jgi:hypothetical protein